MKIDRGRVRHVIRKGSGMTLDRDSVGRGFCVPTGEYWQRWGGWGDIADAGMFTDAGRAVFESRAAEVGGEWLTVVLGPGMLARMGMTDSGVTA